VTQSQSSTNTDPVPSATGNDSSEAHEEMSIADTKPRTLASRLSQGTPSRPLLGRLPLARLIPQDVRGWLVPCEPKRLAMTIRRVPHATRKQAGGLRTTHPAGSGMRRGLAGTARAAPVM